MARRWFSLFVVVVVMLGLVTTSQAAGQTACQPDKVQRIALESAFGSELTLWLKEVRVECAVVVNGRTFTKGTLYGKPVVAYLSGVSMVNAAMTTQVALDLFNIERIFFSGIAGGVNPNLNIGDVVIPSQWAQYQEMHFAREDTPGNYSGVDATLPNFNFMFPQPISVTSSRVPVDTSESIYWFQTDPQMLAVAKAATADVTLADCVERGQKKTCLQSKPIVKVGGNGVAGQTFVDNAAFREWAWKTWQADSLDMESSAVAHVAYVNQVPFLIFRSLSDLAGGGPGANEIGTFFQLAADNAAKVFLATLKRWVEYSDSSKTTTVGIILVGPQEDKGWSEAHFRAVLYAESKIPGVKNVTLDKLNSADRPNTTLDQVVQDMVTEGAKLIITTSDAFQADTTVVAKKYPDITFINVSGDAVLKGDVPKNLGNFMGRMEYMKMVGGCAAALATKTNKIGYLGPLVNDETRRLASAAYLGVRYCFQKYRGGDPNSLRFEVKWIGFWFNIPGVTLNPTEVANGFFDNGTDVVMSGIDTPEAIVVTKQRVDRGEKIFAVPYDYQGACDLGAGACLGVPYFNWGPAYVKAIAEFRAGVWHSNWDWNGPKWSNINDPDESNVGFAYGPALTADQKVTLVGFVNDMGNGKVNLFTGPLNYQSGKVFLTNGEVATDQQIWYMPELLQGMIGASEASK